MVWNNFLNGDLGEVQIYNAVLADADRLAQERALKCKFGMTGVASHRQISLNWTLSAGASGYNLWRSTDGGASYQVAASAPTVSSLVDTNAANGQTKFYQIAATGGCGASVNSAAISVFLPLPAINLNVTANSLTMSWPNWARDCPRGTRHGRRLAGRGIYPASPCAWLATLKRRERRAPGMRIVRPSFSPYAEGREAWRRRQFAGA